MSEYLGIYKGSVLNSNDPEKRGRVILNIPQALGGNPSAWCEPIYPTVYTPKINDVVWVHFVNGDLTKPVYFSSEAVTAEKIAAGAITADKLAATLILASQLFVGQYISITPENGIRIELNNGGHIYLPADGSDADFNRVILRATQAVIEDDMQILGNNNKIGGSLTLATSIPPPSVAPTVTNVFDQSPLDLQYPAAYAGLGDNGTYWQSAAMTSFDGNTGNCTTGVFSFNKTDGTRPTYYTFTVSMYDVQLTHSTSPDFRGNHYEYTGGPAPTPTILSFHSTSNLTVTAYYLPAYSYSWRYVNMSGTTINSGTNSQNQRYEILVTNNTTGAVLSQWVWTEDMNWYHPSVFTDGTYLYVAGCYNNGSMNVARYNTDGSGGVWLFQTAGGVYGPVHLTSLWIGNADYGSQRFVVNWSGGSGVFTSAGVRNGSEEWATAEYPRGVAWDGTRFLMHGGSSKIWKLSTNKTSVNHTTKYTWYNTSTNAESTASPTTTAQYAARQWYSVKSGVIPVISDPSGPTAIRVYIDAHRQNNVPDGVTTVIYETLGTSGVDAPTVDGFAFLTFNGSVTSSAFDASGPIISLKGDGSGRTGPWTWDQNGYSTAYSNAGNLYATGAWSSGAPPNGTTGTSFTINRSGYYRFNAEASAFSSTAGTNHSMSFYIDGVQKSSRTFFFNAASTHTNMGRNSWVQFLTAGTHYLYIQTTATSDANDNTLLTWDPV